MVQKIVDLSFPIHEGMTTFPRHWHPFVEITQLGRHGIENRETRKLVLGTHTGTHMDAPSHFIPNGTTIEKIPLDVLVGPAAVVDLTPLGDNREIGIGDIENRITKIDGRFPQRLILRYDWCRNWGQMGYYQNHSYLSEDTAKWLVEKGLKLLGMDTPMPDNPAHGWGCEIDSPIHKILLGNGVVLVEYLCNLRDLNRSIVEFVGLPMKIKDGDGSPARCIAIVRD